MLAEELREQETQAMLEQMRKVELEDEAALRQKKLDSEKLMAIVAASNAEAIRLKEVRAEEARQEDLKVAQFLREKEAREEALEREKEALHKEKENEAKRLLATQQRALDTMAEKHGIAARRQQEAIERKLRQEEAAKAEKLKQTVAEIGRARAEQIKSKEYHQTLQEEADRAAHERVLRAQAELEQAEKAKAEAEKQKQTAYAVGIREQIQDAEEHRRQSRDKFFEDGRKLDQEAQSRREKLNAIKQRKFEELRAAGLDAKYLSTVSRAIERPAVEKFA